MNKIDIKKLALMGIAGGVLMAQLQANAAQQNGSYNWGNQNYTADASDTSSDQSSNMSESDLLKQLSPEARATYMGLSKEGKELALKLVNQSCKGMNGCKGLNSCKTKDNACAGQGGCKGTSKGPFKDKNKAVAVAAKHMMEERLKAMGNQG